MRWMLVFAILGGCIEEEGADTLEEGTEQPEGEETVDDPTEPEPDDVEEEEEEEEIEDDPEDDPEEEEEEVDDTLDTDGDGLTDAQEAEFGSDPLLVDTDEDGLDDNVEFSLGTSPVLKDTDGDGYSDAIEVAFDTDPTDIDSVYYEGGWPIDDCYDSLTVTGNQVGDVTADFSLTDQHGDTLQLHHFCGHTVLLVSAASWCGVCRSEAPNIQAFYDEMDELGLIPITLLGKNPQNRAPSQEDLQAWADTFSLTHPVVADVNWGVTGRFIDGGSFGIPTLHLIGTGGEVKGRDRYYTRNQLLNQLESAE